MSASPRPTSASTTALRSAALKTPRETRRGGAPLTALEMTDLPGAEKGARGPGRRGRRAGYDIRIMV